MIPLEAFFTRLAEFPFRAIFEGAEAVWEPVGRVQRFIRDEIARLAVSPNVAKAGTPSGLSGHRANRGGLAERLLMAEGLVCVPRDTLLEEFSIYLGKDTIIEPGVVIKPYALIGEECELRQGAYLRENVVAGHRVVIGHGTEVKNSILMDHVEAGHFAYIGDSVLGYHANLGAGVKLANLQLRTAEVQETGAIPPVKIPIGGETYDTGLPKLGAVLGDSVEIGCNAVTSPGTLVGKESWVYPCVNVRKGYYPPGSIIKSDGTVVARRGQEKG